MNLALNSLQRLICHKTQQTKPNQALSSRVCHLYNIGKKHLLPNSASCYQNIAKFWITLEYKFISFFLNISVLVSIADRCTLRYSIHFLNFFTMQSQYSSGVKLVWILCFPSLRLVVSPRTKKLLFTHSWRENKWIHVFFKGTSMKWMQTSSPRI